MANLRDKGYPSAKEYKPNRSDKQNAIMNDTMARFPSWAIQYEGGATRSNPNVDKLISTYNNKVYGNPKMPLVNKIGVDYVTDDTDERAYMGGLDFSNRNNDRLGFAHYDVRPGSTAYYAGVDNLPLGDNYYSKEFNTPYGTFGAEYDGDGTASLSYETSPNLYYVKALANLLMNRGTL